MSTLRVNNVTNIGGSGSTYAPGHVVQIVTASVNTQYAVNSTTFADSGIQATITPKSQNSKILVMIDVSYRLNRTSASLGFGTQLLRDASVIFVEPYPYNSAYYYFGGSTSMEVLGKLPVSYLDSPNTTSAITYKLQGRMEQSTSGAGLQFQNSGGTSMITLMEIAQ